MTTRSIILIFLFPIILIGFMIFSKHSHKVSDPYDYNAPYLSGKSQQGDYGVTWRRQYF